MSRMIAAAGALVLFTSLRAFGQEDDVGQDTYNARCATCHGRDGKGKTEIGRKLKTKDLTEPALLKSLTDAQIEKLIRDGTPDKSMPPYQDKLTAGEVAAVMKYLRVFQPK
jgi:cytochrome c oxidase cbb3-type subunit 3